MKNNQLKGSASIEIFLDKEYYTEGDDITGKISVKIHQNYYIYALEFALSLKSSPHSELLNNSINFQDALKTDSNGNKILPVGMYYFPFCLNVPSEKLEKNSDNIISICLLVKLLSLKGDNGSVASKYLDIYCQTNNIFNPSQISKVNSNSNKNTYTDTKNIKSLLLNSKGWTSLSVQCPKENVKYGDTLTLKCHVDNTKGESIVKFIVLCLRKKTTKISNSKKYRLHKIKKEINIYPYTKRDVTLDLYIIDYSKILQRFKNNNDSEYIVKIYLVYESFIYPKYRPEVIIPIDINQSIM